MKLRLHSISPLVAGLILSAGVSSAQLSLSGHTTGYFDDLAEANTTVVNAPDHSWASFRTGVPSEGSVQSQIVFQNVDFTDVTSGEPIQVGLFNITNGKTYIGSGAPTAKFNVGLELTSPAMQTVAISPITFHIDHTPNFPNDKPDTFAVTFSQPPPIKIQDTLVQFHLNVEPPEFQIGENATIQKGDITVSFTPVPEPSTYALAGAAMLVGVAAYRRRRTPAPQLIAS